MSCHLFLFSRVHLQCNTFRFLLQLRSMNQCPGRSLQSINEMKQSWLDLYGKMLTRHHHHDARRYRDTTHVGIFLRATECKGQCRWCSKIHWLLFFCHDGSLPPSWWRHQLVELKSSQLRQCCYLLRVGRSCINPKIQDYQNSGWFWK